MQSCIRKLSALLLGVCLLGWVSSARAGYEYEILDDGVLQGTIQVPVGNAFTTGTIATTHFDIVIGSSLTSPGANNTTLSSNLQAHELSTATGTNTITLELVYQGYTQPAGSPLSVSTSSSAAFTNSVSADGATFQTWAVDDPSGGFQDGSTAGQQSVAAPNGSTTSALVLTPDPAVFSLPVTGAFSVSQTLSLSLSNGANNQSGQVQGLTTITGPATVPAPSTAVFALSALPLLGLGAWMGLRKKRNLSAAA